MEFEDYEDVVAYFVTCKECGGAGCQKCKGSGRILKIFVQDEYGVELIRG